MHRRHLEQPLSFVGNFVGLAYPLDMCKSKLAKVHTRDKNLVRADDIQQL